MSEDFRQDRRNRRGCFLVIAGIGVAILLLAAIGMGWLGPIDRGKATDLPVVGSGS